MDLELFHQRKLAKTLLNTYLGLFKAITSPADWQILNYYKCLRANVRAKVHLMAAVQEQSRAVTTSQFALARRYLDQMTRYTLPAAGGRKNHPAI